MKDNFTLRMLYLANISTIQSVSFKYQRQSVKAKQQDRVIHKLLPRSIALRKVSWSQ